MTSAAPTMSDTLHPGYQDILTQNYHLFSRYLIAEDFISELIGKEVLSTNDKEHITNPYVNQTRRQKASKYPVRYPYLRRRPYKDNI